MLKIDKIRWIFLSYTIQYYGMGYFYCYETTKLTKRVNATQKILLQLALEYFIIYVTITVISKLHGKKFT